MKYSKLYNKNVVLLRGEIITEPDRKKYTDKTKLAFDIKTETGKTITCVHWTNVNISKGDNVQMVGWIKDKIFLATGLLYTRR